ncbi:ComEA family DNA-binding protein [Thermotoga profunda]|uniref:ComEA family DNA-binding protein n=1 Tax=Thermotoga profunda TaxID=1508420 RepID=UPI000597B7E7|nr:ComEA family DNA-binding protein [Thermotoga profunda]
MKLSVSEKRLILISFVGLILLLGFALEKSYKKEDVASEEVARRTIEFPIDINVASYEELLEIPGIGPAKARAIIQFREQNGPFKTVDDLVKVSGIGKSTAQRISNYVRLGSSSVPSSIRKINVNTATLEELLELPGIGEVKASEIIKFREKNGFFKKPEDLLQVPGIGPKTVEKIKDMIAF